MKTKIFIPIHSVIDVITNSSTELFIIDKEKGLEFVQEVVNQAYAKYPSMYGSCPHAHLDNPEYYDGSFGCFDVEEAVKKLEQRGYKVIAPEVVKEPEVIVVSWERGYMQKEFIDIIEKTFNIEVDNN